MNIPAWLGFIIIIIVGIVAIIYGAVAFAPANAGFIAFGVWAIISSVLAWATGATSAPSGTDFGGVVTKLRWWVWLIVAVLFVGVFIAFNVR